MEVLVLLTIVFGAFKEMRLRNKKTRIERYCISCRIHCLFCGYECHWHLFVFCCCFSVLSHVLLFMTLWTVEFQASLPFSVPLSLLRFMSIQLVMAFNHLILCHCLLPLPSNISSIRVFSNKRTRCIRGPIYWSFRISPSNEYSWLISFRIEWFDLLVVQGTLKSLLWHHSLKASIFSCLSFIMV